LLYGVPELPMNPPENFRKNGFADNVGLVMLRSQTTNRPVSDQIQAVLHYGTHGWAHGHFDRTDLLSLMRNGRSFWNPESVFWVYEPFMYKFYCQCSVNHNMVVVDEKMQEANPGERLLFHSGDAMQATVVQTDTRWSNPPYGGMVYDYVPVKTFAEKCWREGRSVPIPTNAPPYGAISGYSEKILQRRAMIVTDDYIVLADWVKGTNVHTFESLFQMKDFQGLEAPEKKFLRHDAQWDADPVGSAQFVTDCNWYSVAAPAVSRFQMRFGPGADNEGSRTVGNEDGVLKTDVHSLWPPRQEIMIGTAPEFFPVEKRLFYTVRGDGKILADGKFGAWILGSADVDVSVEGLKQLELETRTELSKQPTLFWANARIVTKDGKEIPLGGLPVKFENIEQPKEAGKDYFGGPIKIVGNEYQSATPAQPVTNGVNGLVRVDLSGVGAVRFKATLGGDFPLGDETQRRKVYAIRATADGGVAATEARFLTVIEPYEDQPMVKSAVAMSADSLRVELADGRVQEISLKNFDGSGADIEISLVETKDGQRVREESAVK
jgi:peptidoglycan hydrolase-like protein with peptidoglycan-binding domain